jgi:glycosyltransferase involved in cell wall biosynthesis
MKILYVVSTLAPSGPTNQLYNIINNLNKQNYIPTVITLSPESTNSCWAEYQLLGINLYSLNLSRLTGLFLSKYKLASLIREINPDLVHTQGIRADSLLANLNLTIPWVMTSRNFPSEDYPSKFGRLKGGVMERQHFLSMRKCFNIVSCSKSIMEKLAGIGIKSIAIQNGVKVIEGDSDHVPLVKNLPKPIFVTVGSLIPRKNTHFLIDAFKHACSNETGSLVILGDGYERKELEKNSANNIHFVGNVNNVQDYLVASDYFVSSSLSEGLPNTVLEALAVGVPVILSNIPSHVEIELDSNGSCALFSLDDKTELVKILSNPDSYFSEDSKKDALRLGEDIFSAKRMSLKYQDLYKELIN